MSLRVIFYYTRATSRCLAMLHLLGRRGAIETVSPPISDVVGALRSGLCGYDGRAQAAMRWSGNGWKSW